MIGSKYDLNQKTLDNLAFEMLKFIFEASYNFSKKEFSYKTTENEIYKANVIYHYLAA
jgi:hypothetical protein